MRRKSQQESAKTINAYSYIQYGSSNNLKSKKGKKSMLSTVDRKYIQDNNINASFDHNLSNTQKNRSISEYMMQSKSTGMDSELGQRNRGQSDSKKTIDKNREMLKHIMQNNYFISNDKKTIDSLQQLQNSNYEDYYLA